MKQCGLYFYGVLCYIFKCNLFVLKVFFLIFSCFVNFLFLSLDFVKSSFIILLFLKVHLLTGQGPSHKNTKWYQFFSPLTLELKMQAVSLDFIWDNTIAWCNQLLCRGVLNSGNDLLTKKSSYRGMCAPAVNCKPALRLYHEIAMLWRAASVGFVLICSQCSINNVGRPCGKRSLLVSHSPCHGAMFGHWLGACGRRAQAFLTGLTAEGS